MRTSLEPISCKESTWSLRITNPAPSVFCTRLEGRVDDRAVQKILEAFDLMTAEWGASDVFHDWMDLVSYTSEARRLFTAGAIRQMPLVSSVHVLFTSKIVAMGVSVVNLALGSPIKMHTNRENFETARSNCMLKRRAASGTSSTPVSS
jgi:hypothetical protein